MRKVSVMLRREVVNGRVRLVAKSSAYHEMYNDFLVRLPEDAVVRARFNVAGDREEWRSDKRASYFAYLARCVSDGPEAFTKNFVGITRDEKVRELHFHLKKEYCKLFAQMYYVEHDPFTGEREEKVFSVSDTRCHLDDNALENYYLWAKDTLFHTTSVPYRPDDE